MGRKKIEAVFPTSIEYFVRNLCNKRVKERIELYWKMLLTLITNRNPYFTTDVESVTVAVVSTFTTAESTTTAVESVVASVVPLPPHAVKAAIAKIAITFFIFCLFCLN